MKRRAMMTTVGFAVLVAGLLVNAPAEANTFEDRTTHLVLEFPVRVPGATNLADRLFGIVALKSIRVLRCL